MTTASRAKARPRLPLLDANERWSERFGRHIGGAEMWRQICGLAGIVVLCEAALIAWIGLTPPVLPVAVMMEPTGAHFVVGAAPSVPGSDPRIVAPVLKRFVADLHAPARKDDDALGLTFIAPGSAAEGAVKRMRAQLAVAPIDGQRALDVDVRLVERDADGRWRVEWNERRSGETSTGSLRALALSVAHRPAVGLAPIDARNPLGLYIENVESIAPRPASPTSEPASRSQQQ